MKNLYAVLRVLFVNLLVVGAFSVALAQDIAPVAPLNLASEPVVLEYSLGAAGPPTIEPLTDGRMTFRIQGAGEVSGGLEGSLSALVSEVTAMPSPPLHPVTVMFTIETDDGTLDGFTLEVSTLPKDRIRRRFMAMGVSCPSRARMPICTLLMCL